MSKSERKRQKYEATRDTGGALPHVAIGYDEWLVDYKNGTVEIFYRDGKGFIRGAGPAPDVDACGRSMFRQRVLANRPPCVSSSARVQAAYDQGYFVVPSVMDETPPATL